MCFLGPLQKKILASDMWSFNTEILLYSILSDAKKGTICVHEHQQTLLFSECFKNCCEIRLRIYVNPPTTHELQEVDIKQTSRKCNGDVMSCLQLSLSVTEYNQSLRIPRHTLFIKTTIQWKKTYTYVCKI